MAACISMLQDRAGQWAQSVKNLTPKTWEHLTGVFAAYHNSQQAGLYLDTPIATSVMWIMENNPVLSAYGTAETMRRNLMNSATQSLSHNPLVIEWDIYLPKSICEEVTKTMGSNGVPRHFPLISDKETATTSNSVRVSGKDISSQKGETPSEGYLSLEEYRTLCVKVLDACIVAHGTVREVILERAIGKCMYHNVAERTGGITIRQWLRIYFESLRQHSPNVFSRIYTAIHAGQNDIDEPMGKTPQPIISVFLDVKSAAANSMVLHCLLDGLNSMGIHVWGVGSFIHNQVQGLGFGHQKITISPDTFKESLGLHDISKNTSCNETDVITPAWKSMEKDVSSLNTPFGSPSSTMKHRHLAGNARCFHEIPTGNRRSDTTECDSPIEPTLENRTVMAKPVVPLYIYSMVGEIQSAALRKQLPKGTSILFNGGTLLLQASDKRYIENNCLFETLSNIEDDMETLATEYHVSPSLLSNLIELNEAARERDFKWRVDLKTLLAFQRLCSTHDIRAGIYIQEAILDEEAAYLVVSVANLATEAFPYGLSYSNLNGEVPSHHNIPHGKGFSLPRFLDMLLSKEWNHTL